MGPSVPSSLQVTRLIETSPLLLLKKMAAAFMGKLVSQENFDEYLKAIGVGMAKRALARAATPTVDYSMNGDEMTVTTTGMRDTSITFKIGVEKDEETADGRKVKS